MVSLLVILSIDYLLSFKQQQDVASSTPGPDTVSFERLYGDLMQYAKEVVKRHRQEVQ